MCPLAYFASGNDTRRRPGPVPPSAGRWAASSEWLQTAVGVDMNRSLLLTFTVMSLAVASSGLHTHRAASAQTSSGPPLLDGLVLRRLSTNLVAGEYTPVNQAPLSFEAARDTSRAYFTIRQSRLEILSYREDETAFSIAVADGAAGWTALKPLMARAADAARTGNEAEQRRLIGRAVTQHGNQALFETLTASDTGLALVSLSTALGRRGLNGKAFPPLVFLHLLAMQIGTTRGMPPPELPSDQAQLFLSESESCQSLIGDPNNDGCYGMCGPGCSCWQSICGQCCCYDGCRSHDGTCRNCAWHKPWNCLLCASFTSFFWGACGTNCQSTVPWEPYPFDHYAQCGLERVAPFPALDEWGVCGGMHEGSDESSAAPVQWACNRGEYWEDGAGSAFYTLRCYPQ